MSRGAKLIACTLALAVVATASACRGGDGVGPRARSRSTETGSVASRLGDAATASAVVAAGEASATLDASLGGGAAAMQATLARAAAQPLAAAGEPIVVGLQNHDGALGSGFADYRAGVEAAVSFVNERLGGIGADLAAGVPGRPVRLASCAMGLNPAESARCAGELAAARPVAVLEGVNFFGEQAYDVFRPAGIAVVAGAPAGPADLQAVGVAALTGGCLGVESGAVLYAATDLGAKRVMVAWPDTAPGAACYHDLQRKPLDILNGSLPGASPHAGTATGMVHDQVAIKPGTTDLADVAADIIAFRPDAIVYSARPADCWALVAALAEQGWDGAAAPLVLGGPCASPSAITAAGPAAAGLVFVEDGERFEAVPDAQVGGEADDVVAGLVRSEVEVVVDQLAGRRPGVDPAGQAGSAFATTMTMWQLLDDAVAAAGGPERLTPGAVQGALAATRHRHRFAGLPFGCADAGLPYRAACASMVRARRWDGSGWQVAKPPFDPSGVVAGTALDLGK